MCDDPVPGEIPGDPDVVARFARAFDDTAQALREAAAGLRAVANESITISLAVDEVRSRAADVDTATGQVAIRYQGAADAFASYSTALADAQARGNTARADIVGNNADGRYWRHRVLDLRDALLSGDPERLSDFNEARRRANFYDGQYAVFSSRHTSAVEARDRAAETAIAALQAAETAAGLNDGFFESILGDLQLLWELASEYLGPVLEVLRGVLEILKQIIDVLALIVTVLAFIFPLLAPLAGALSALSVILAVAIFALSAILFLMGRETLGRVMSDGIGALIGVVTSKLGGASLNPLTQFSDAAGDVALVGANVGLRGEAARSFAVSVGLDLRTAAQVGTETLVGGLVSANVAPIDYVVSEGLDFTLAGETAWGETAPPAFSMEGADPAALLAGLAELPTLGVAGLVVQVPEIGLNVVNAWGEVSSTWSQVSAVPAT